MIKSKTRMTSNQRRSIVLAHTTNIKPATIHTEQGIEELRRKGNRVLSQIAACIARRESFKVGTGNIIKG